MTLRIQTNMQSLTAQRFLLGSTQANDKASERLASGFRINRASDDAAGLAVSEKLKADIRGFGQAKRNANDGISMVQIAEGGLNEIGNILSRLRELSVQGASDTIGNEERGFLNKEYFQLKDEIDRITRSTEFNGTMLLMGAQEGLPEAVAARANPFPLEIQVGRNYFQELDGQEVRNPSNIIRINMLDGNTLTEGEQGLNLGSVDNENGTRVDSKISAQSAINVIDKAISKVVNQRATLGAYQSRLNSTISNLDTQIENFSAANSRIRDTDYADESAKLTQSNIIKQSGIAILAQANQSPQAALRLLNG